MFQFFMAFVKKYKKHPLIQRVGKTQTVKTSEVWRKSGTQDTKHRRQEPVPPVCAEESPPGPTERAELGQEGWASNKRGSEVESAGTRSGAETGWQKVSQ